MTNKIDISFILPCYNVAQYVEDCIKSIVKQDIDSCEIICVDDCSTDGTFETLEKLCKNIKTLKVIRNQENCGLSHSRNVGIDASCGEYLWFVDPDDFLVDGSAKYLLSLAEKKKADCIMGNYVELQLREELSELMKCSLFNKSEKEGLNITYRCINQKGAVAGSVCMGLWRKQWLISNGLYFKEKVYPEDVLFNMVSEKYDRYVVKTELPVYVYCVRGGSLTTDISAEAYYRKIYYAIESVRVYFEESRLDRKDVEKLKYRINELQVDLLLKLTKLNDRRKIEEYLTILDNEKLLKKQKTSFKSKKEINCLRSVNKLFIRRRIWFWLNWLARKITKKTIR